MSGFTSYLKETFSVSLDFLFLVGSLEEVADEMLSTIEEKREFMYRCLKDTLCTLTKYEIYRYYRRFSLARSINLITQSSIEFDDIEYSYEQAYDFNELLTDYEDYDELIECVYKLSNKDIVNNIVDKLDQLKDGACIY